VERNVSAVGTTITGEPPQHGPGHPHRRAHALGHADHHGPERRYPCSDGSGRVNFLVALA
jgi:hypothetical protein